MQIHGQKIMLNRFLLIGMVLASFVVMPVMAADSPWWMHDSEVDVASYVKDKKGNVTTGGFTLKVTLVKGKDYAIIQTLNPFVHEINGQRISEQDIPLEVNALLKLTPAIAVNSVGEVLEVQNTDKLISATVNLVEDADLRMKLSSFYKLPMVKQLIDQKAQEYWSLWSMSYQFKDLPIGEFGPNQETLESIGAPFTESVLIKLSESTKYSGLRELKISRATIGDSFSRALEKIVMKSNLLPNSKGESQGKLEASRATTNWLSFYPDSGRPDQIKLNVITSITSKDTKAKQTAIEEKRFKFFWDKKRFSN